MPQLDLTTFSTQFFWLIIFFSFFYLAIAKIVVPNLNRVYKLREQSTGFSSPEFYSGYNNSLFLSAFSSLKKSVQAEKELLNIQKSLSESLTPLYKKYLKDRARFWFNSSLKERIYRGQPKKHMATTHQNKKLGLSGQQQINLLQCCLGENLL